jgi:hypothetical protein
MQALFMSRSLQAALLIEQYGPGNWSGLGIFISLIEPAGISSPFIPMLARISIIILSFGLLQALWA